MTSLIEELEGTMSRPFTDHPPYPMLAHKRDLVDADSRGWVAELKMDGRRAMAIRTANGVDIYSRNMKSQKGKCPHLEDAMMDLPPGTVLDGEVVMPNDEEVEIIGKMTKSVNFTWTANVIGSKPDRAQRVQEELGRKIHFVTFDCMYLGYRNLMNDPFNWRRKYLVEVFEKYLYDCPYFVLSPLFEPGDELVEEVLEAGYEGIMLKHKESTYEEGGRGWGKYKFVDDADTVVMGFTDGQGKYSDTIGAICFGQYKDGKLVQRGQCSGMNDDIRFHVGENHESYLGRVMTVKVQAGVPGSRRFRHPQFHSFREDKNPKECMWDD